LQLLTSSEEDQAVKAMFRQPPARAVTFGNQSYRFCLNKQQCTILPPLNPQKVNTSFKRYISITQHLSASELRLQLDDQKKYFQLFIQHLDQNGKPIIGVKARCALTKGQSWVYHGCYLSQEMYREFDTAIGRRWSETSVDVSESNTY
jgi:hypothetical protein